VDNEGGCVFRFFLRVSEKDVGRKIAWAWEKEAYIPLICVLGRPAVTTTSKGQGRGNDVQ